MGVLRAGESHNHRLDDARILCGHSTVSYKGVAVCVADCRLRLFEMRFQARFALLLPLKCGFMCGLRFLNVFGSRFASSFDAVCSFR